MAERGWPISAALGAATALYGLIESGRTPLWRDEGWTASIVSRPAADAWRIVSSQEANMGPYYLALKGWSLLAGSDAGLRAFSVLGGIVALVALVTFLARHFGSRSAAVAGLLLCVNPFFLRYLTEARAYSWSMALAVLSTLAIVRVTPASSPWWAAVYGATVGIGAAVNLVAFAVPVAHAVALLPELRESRYRRRFALAGLVAAVCFLPFAAPYLRRRHDHVSWIAPLTPRSAAIAVRELLGGPRPALILAGAALVGLALALVGGSPRRTHPTLPVRLLVALTVVPPLALAVVSTTIQPLFLGRYLAPAFPFLVAVVAVLVTAAARRHTRSVVLLAAAAVALTAASHPWRQSRPEDLRQAASFLAAHLDPGDAVVFYPAYTRIGFSRYGRVPRSADVALSTWPSSQLFPDERATPEIRARLATTTRLWVVGYKSGTPAGDWHPTAEPVAPITTDLRFADVSEERQFGAITLTLRVAPRAGAKLYERSANPDRPRSVETIRAR